MEVQNLIALTRFCHRHALSRKPMERWLSITMKAKWTSLIEIRDDFPAADYVNGKYVFNIGGNDFRLLTDVDFVDQVITIREALTHEDYSKLRL